MTLLAPISYAFGVFVGRWRLWLVLAWLPLLGLLLRISLQRVGSSCFAGEGGNCLLGSWPYGLALAFEAWSPLFIEGLYVLFFIPAITALYRHLLAESAGTKPMGVRWSGAELRYAGYHLLLYYPALVVGESLWFLFSPRYAALRPDLPDTPEWILIHFGHPFFWPIYLVMIVAFARFYLIFPHVALGRRGGFLDLLAHSRGQLLAIVLALVAVRILSLFVEAAIELPAGLLVELVADLGEEIAAAFESAVGYGAAFANDYTRAVGSLAVLAWFYRRFVLSREG